MSLRLFPFAALAVLTLCLSARAANPKVTLRLENATPAEAAAALSTAAGVPLELTGELPKGPERASFEWNETPFAAALRQLCEKFRVQPRRKPDGGYSLYPWPGAAAAQAPKVTGLFERNGVRMYATGVTIEERRIRNFMAVDAAPEDCRMQLRLFCELGERDADSMLGIENVVARDDMGGALSFSSAQPSYMGYYEAQYPDQWPATLSFSLPNPRARKIASVEGDLVAYQTVRPHRVEIPVPLEGKSVRRQVGDWLIVVSQYEPAPQPVPDDDEGLPPVVARYPVQGARVRLRVYYPHRSAVTGRTGMSMYPQIQGMTGRLYYPISTDGKGAGNQQLMLTDTYLYLSTPGDRPAKLVWDLVEKSEPIRLVRFRMEDIPLPEQRLGPAPVKTPAAPEAVEGDLDHPFYQKDGGLVSLPLELPDMSPTRGRLEVGLQEKQGAGWGPVRWAELEARRDGNYLLGPLKPGTYRMRRLYRPIGNPGILATGHWLNADGTVTVRPGATTTAPVLRWTKEPPGAVRK